MDVSVRDLKNHLSEYLRRVQAGEDIRVTSRGRVIARLSGDTQEAGDESDQAFIERLESQAWVNPATTPGEKPSGVRHPAPARPGTPSSDDLIDWVRE